MPHDEERIPGDRLAEEMETAPPVPNIGWECTTVPGCGFESRTMPGAANAVLEHIKLRHPDQFNNGLWSMSAIRKNA